MPLSKYQYQESEIDWTSRFKQDKMLQYPGRRSWRRLFWFYQTSPSTWIHQDTKEFQWHGNLSCALSSSLLFPSSSLHSACVHQSLDQQSGDWFTVPWAAILGREATCRYELHSSEWMIVPGTVWAWMIGRSVAASLLSTTSMCPKAGVCDVSTKPNTHTSCEVVRPLWCCDVMDTLLMVC